MQEREPLNKKWVGLFEPDTLLPILPSQYFEAMRRKHRLEGDKRLVLKVLEDAIDCFMKFIHSSTEKHRSLFRDAEEWINLEDKRWIFSFDNVCELLNLNPEYMRRGLRGWKERKLEAIEEARTTAAEQTAAASTTAPKGETPIDPRQLSRRNPCSSPSGRAAGKAISPTPK